MSDREKVRALITRAQHLSRPGSDLAALTELGAVHLTVLEMLAESVQRLHDAGISKAAIHHALSDEVILAQFNPIDLPEPSERHNARH